MLSSDESASASTSSNFRQPSKRSFTPSRSRISSSKLVSASSSLSPPINTSKC
ncbi:hypothetical protein FOCG_18458 [Fusarium oxysporum f. sp. radicis-lycopersici 26381]|nr:hypothetical protein FOCG_18458 [Fusarium oxysporum f. sp. radicis-lycopersici 26381]